jgi:hypothetical protein
VKETFQKIVKGMGFSFKNCKNRTSVLIEGQNVACNAAYFRTLRNYENGPMKPAVTLGFTPIAYCNSVGSMIQGRSKSYSSCRARD